MQNILWLISRSIWMVEIIIKTVQFRPSPIHISYISIYDCSFMRAMMCHSEVDISRILFLKFHSFDVYAKKNEFKTSAFSLVIIPATQIVLSLSSNEANAYTHFSNSSVHQLARTILHIYINSNYVYEYKILSAENMIWKWWARRWVRWAHTHKEQVRLWWLPFLKLRGTFRIIYLFNKQYK